MLQQYCLAPLFVDCSSWEKRQAVHTALEVMAKNREKKGSELALMLRALHVPIEIAVMLFAGLGHLAIVQPTEEKGVLALHVSDSRIALSQEQRENARFFRDRGPHGKPVPAIPWKTA